jgi:hypothetical protein
MTSSPGPTPWASSARWIATGPIRVDSAYRVPHHAANSRSKRSTKGPVEEIHELAIASATYSASRPDRSGCATAIERS